MRRWRQLGAVATIALLALSTAAAGPRPALAQAEKRVALVIGNAAYKDAPLKNPANDARAMAARLSQLGFEVVARENATRQAMAGALAEFVRKLTPGSAALVYYAGHGVQARGRNYLIPVDASLEAEGDLWFQGVDIASLTEELDQAQSRVSIVILDACRNNPFERRMRGAAGRGLAPVDAARGTLIAYATAPGAVAADGDGDNGVYTAALLKALAMPGLSAEAVFKRVRVEVAAATGNLQTPWESSSLTGDFVFNIPGDATPPAQATGNPTANSTATDRELLFWQSAQGTNRPEEYQEYLKQYPQGTFAGLARARIAAFKAQAKTASAAAPAAAAPPVSSRPATTPAPAPAPPPAPPPQVAALPKAEPCDGSYRGMMTQSFAGTAQGEGAVEFDVKGGQVTGAAISHMTKIRRPIAGRVDAACKLVDVVGQGATGRFVLNGTLTEGTGRNLDGDPMRLEFRTRRID